MVGMRVGWWWGASRGLTENNGEGLAGAVQLTTHGVTGLAGQGADFFVAQLFVGHEEEEEAIFFRKGPEGRLNALTEFLGLKDAQGTFGGATGACPDGLVIGAGDVPAMPGLEHMLAMIDRDAIEPGANTRIAFEVAELPIGL